MTIAEQRLNFILLAEWDRYSPFQSLIFTAIDIAQPATASHKLVRLGHAMQSMNKIIESRIVMSPLL